MDPICHLALKQHKKSFTPERGIIFSVAFKKKHFSAQELFDEIKLSYKISRMSVFRSVHLFEEIGVFRRIFTNDSVVRYEVMQESNHHEHMQCLQCGIIIEFSDRVFHELLEQIAKEYDFSMKDHGILIRGLCSSCEGKEEK